jgi:hypothetical protein
LRALAEEDLAAFDDNPCVTISTQESDARIHCGKSKDASLSIRVCLVEYLEFKIKKGIGWKRGFVKYLSEFECQIFLGNCKGDVSQENIHLA